MKISTYAEAEGALDKARKHKKGTEPTWESPEILWRK